MKETVIVEKEVTREVVKVVMATPEPTVIVATAAPGVAPTTPAGFSAFLKEDRKAAETLADEVIGYITGARTV